MGTSIVPSHPVLLSPGGCVPARPPGVLSTAGRVLHACVDLSGGVHRACHSRELVALAQVEPVATRSLSMACVVTLHTRDWRPQMRRRPPAGRSPDQGPRRG
jgi:hypothetical protein